MKILAFAGSLRAGSLNRKLILLAAGIAERIDDVDVDLAHFGEFQMPLYDGDVENTQGLPPGARELRQRIEAAEALIISSPEYNFSVPGTLKNAIDWVSRARPMPWRGKPALLMSASPSAVGGLRGLAQLRLVLSGCGSVVFPDVFSLAHANKAFNEEGRLDDPQLTERLERTIHNFVPVARAVGQAWVRPPAQ